MKVISATPVAQREFTLQLTETELSTLTSALAKISHDQCKEHSSRMGWPVGSFGETTLLYRTLKYDVLGVK